MKQILLTIISLTFILVLHGCAIHKIDIQQGNIFDEDLARQIEPGMTKKEVEFILGQPLIISAFNSDSWHYIYDLKLGDGSKSETKQLSLLFEDGRLKSIKKQR